jgi:hemoglobin/transferrin/lactoferrin receptor protein
MDELTKSDLVDRKTINDIKVVSASRSDHKISDLPTSIQVITREEIERNGYVTLVDVLKHIAGIRVSKPGNGADGETFLFRGLIGNYYTKILINSIPIQPSVTGSIAIAVQLPVAQAERIEIIFGPSSALYGGDAMAGVINIITRTTDNNPFAQATLTTGDLGYRYGSFMAGGKAGKNKNVVKYSLYGTFSERQDLDIRYDTDNFSPLNTYFFNEDERRLAQQQPELFLIALRQNYPYYKGTTTLPTLGKMPQRSYMVGAQMEYRSFQLAYIEMDRTNFASTGFNPLTFSYDNPESFYRDKIRRLTGSFNKSWEKISITTNLSYNQYRFNNRSSRATTYRGYNGRSFKYQASDDIFLENLLRYSTKRKWEWTLGTSLQLSSNLPETNDLEVPFNESDYQPFLLTKPKPHPLYGDFGYNPTNFTNVGVFMQGVRVGKILTHIIGIRTDIHAIHQPELTLRYALQGKVNDKISVRLSMAEAFKNPAPYIRHSSIALPGEFYGGINYQQIPNPDLVAEQLTTSEIGMRYQINENTSFEFIAYTQAFPRRINNVYVRIDTTLYPKAEPFNTSAGLPYPVARQYLNDSSSHAVLQMLQFLFRKQNLLNNWHLNIEANASFNFGNEDLPGEEGVIRGYRMMPLFLGQLNLDFTPHKNWYVRLENVFSTKWHRRYIPLAKEYNDPFNVVNGFYTLDVVARYKWSKNIHTHLKILNVFNAQYGGIDATGLDVDLRYNPQLGTNIQFGLNFNLD